MIEITEVAKEAINTIAPYLAIGGQEIIKGVASDLWTKIKSVFQKKGEKKLIEEFKNKPTDANIKGQIEYILESELKENNELVANLTELIRSVQASEEYKNIVTQIGDNNISVAGKISNSTININK